MQLELNINKKVLPDTPLSRPGTVKAAAEGQFALILDRAVGGTQEQSVAADNPSEAEWAPPLKVLPLVKAKILPELGSLFDSAAGLTLTEQKTSQVKPQTQAEDSAPESAAAEDEETEQPSAAPVGLIQTQLEVITKNPRGDLAVAEIEAADKPLPPKLVAAPAPFTEIYADMLRAVQAKKDGQILKFKFALEPENLGKLDVYIFADQKKLHISFAAAEDARQLLAADAPELRDVLAKFGFNLTDLDFSGYSGRRHQELETQFAAQGAGQNDFGMLKRVSANDIIKEVKSLLGDVLVNYLA
ncbi:hypothetical protein NO2_1109 [Candidatus Termititenax persephonae]|uniref:Flagellar hook-length control protein-like C-terminal domain-containing protein n=1 Tax=Candidatus Termititenax persephonae TaxID=2218525 RepID=A0A388THG7_9BACT|nr:hypothetical protein NO2_1109 [Candidatus Termititenax persephonae]